MSKKLVPIVPIGESGNTKQIPPSKHWVFTLNNYKDSDIYDLRNNSSVKCLSMQEETGESGTPHLQGYIEFVKKVRPKSVFKHLSPHWEKCRNIKASIEYTQKAESRTGKQYLKGIRKIRKLKTLRYDQLYDWQREITDIANTEPNDRDIYWYWESIGNVGKSALVKYLVRNMGALLVSGKSKDIKYQLMSIKDKMYPDIIVYDIPRAARNYVNYVALEEIKNGLFCSSKYESQMVDMPVPHIICFANFEPNLVDTMSLDRWKISEIQM